MDRRPGAAGYYESQAPERPATVDRRPGCGRLRWIAAPRSGPLLRIAGQEAASYVGPTNETVQIRENKKLGFVRVSFLFVPVPYCSFLFLIFPSFS